MTTRRAGAAGAILLALFAALAAGASWLAPYDPSAIDAGPWLATPSPAHWMGTDNLGRDQWSRWLFAARLSLSLAVGVMVWSTLLGAAVGVISGAVGGVVEHALGFVTDLLLSLPRLVLVLAAVGLLRLHGTANLQVLIGVLGATSWMGLARVVRAEVRGWMRRDSVLAATGLGVPWARVLLFHVLPHTGAYLAVAAALSAGHAILAEATLSYLGLGVPPPMPSWGTLVADGASHVHAAPWLVALPGASIVVTVVACSLVGDWVRDRLDPRRGGPE